MICIGNTLAMLYSVFVTVFYIIIFPFCFPLYFFRGRDEEIFEHKSLITNLSIGLNMFRVFKRIVLLSTHNNLFD